MPRGHHTPLEFAVGDTVRIHPDFKESHSNVKGGVVTAIKGGSRDYVPVIDGDEFLSHWYWWIYERVETENPW